MISVNKTIKILIASDSFFEMAAGFVTPIFAIFLIDSIEGGNIQLAGTAVAIYWIVKSIFRVPLAYFLDKKRGEKDDYYSMVLGFSLYAICTFLFLFAKTNWHIYAIQTMMGIGGAFAYTPWYGFFSRHIDKNQENMEWSISVSITGAVIALSGFLAGVLAEKFGFQPIFVISGFIYLIGIFLLFLFDKKIRKGRVIKAAELES
ncbi:MAG: MFS transporter [Candidatus Pacebacteria bacterium]|nr:MFS transporter [Candidatus Paceibacterota bacterium]